MRIGWEEWLSSREAKRESLRRAGLDAPSRRSTSHSAADVRMRRSFGGRRIPEWAERHEEDAR